MAKVDERAVVPELDEAAERRLREALDREGVVAASVIGSHASGRAGRLSDIDIGVWLLPELSIAERAALADELSLAAIDALGTSEVDLVVLNDAPPLLRHRAFCEGRRLLERVPVARVRLETRGLLDYLDTAWLRERLAEGRRRRVAEGRFGRR